MFRKLVIGLAALLATACSYGSAVDIAPMKDRAAKPILADGDYCELAMKTKPYTVQTSEGCMKLTWNAESRNYLLVELEKPKAAGDTDQAADKDEPDEIVAAVVPLGGGLYAAQVDVSTEDRAKSPERTDVHQINVFAAQGTAWVTLPVLEDEKLIALAKKQKRIKFGDMPDGSKPQPDSLWSKRPFIAEGSISDIKAFLREATRQSVRDMKKDDWDEFSLGVLDSHASPDHPASAQQAKDAEAVRKILQKLR
jgi:hypothetical protein